MSEAIQGATRPGAGESRVCVLVVGMHRSGTSALTRMLNLLGCDIAKSLVPPDRFNERGYWEAPEIAELNDAILAAAGSSWEDWLPLDPAWREARPEFEAQAKALLDRFFAESGLFLIKDPRISRLLPFWRDALQGVGAEVRVVLPLRPPVEVAASLLKRNGMNPSIAQLVWLRHVLDAEATSRNLPRVVVSYDELTRDWRSAVVDIGERLNLDLAFGPDVERELDAFLSPDLRHHDAKAVETLVNAAPIEAPWFEIAWANLRAGADAPEERAQLDAVREEFDRATLTFGRPITELGAHGRYLKSKLDAAEAKAALADKLREDLATSGQNLEEAQAKAAAVHALFTEASRSLMQRNAELESARQQLGAVESSRSWRFTAPYRRAGSWPRRRLRALAPTPLGQRLIRWRNRLRHLLR